MYINRIKTKTSAKATIAEEKNEKEKKNTEKTEKKTTAKFREIKSTKTIIRKGNGV